MLKLNFCFTFVIIKCILYYIEVQMVDCIFLNQNNIGGCVLMLYDLEKVRKSYKKSIEEFASVLGISPYYYETYEKEGEIPCKYIYKLYQHYPNFPIPADFFCYTSFTLCVNMKYHQMKQVDLAKKFGVMQQTISHYITNKKPILMYEDKDKFIKAFDPLIMPFTVKKANEDNLEVEQMTQMSIKGNLVAAKRKQIYKQQRERMGLTTKEYREYRMQQKDAILGITAKTTKPKKKATTKK